MMTKHLFSLAISASVVAFLALSCHAPALEEIQEPGGQETEVVPERTTIPYSLKVGTEGTRVSFVENQDGTSRYEYKNGDHLHIVGLDDRDDIVGDLTTHDGDNWSGTLSYSTDKGQPVSETNLEVTLIHADNQDASTYASALVGTGEIEGCVTEGQLLRYAVEHYSLFTAQFSFGATEIITLKQQATFLDVKVKFIFDGTHEVEAGNALVDLRTTRGEATGRTVFFPEDNNKDFRVHFVAVIPGDQAIDQFTITIGDRAVGFTYDIENPPTLARNTKYTVTRDITYGPQLGDPFWSDGTYGRFDHGSSGASIVGIIVYVNHNYTPGTDEAIIDDAITEKASGYGHGLVMALRNAGSRVKWSDSMGSHLTDNSVTTPAESLAAGQLSGYKNTKSIGSLGSAANAAATYDVDVVVNDPDDATKKVTTGWFLPSIGQWIYSISIDGFGGADHADKWTDNTDSSPKKWLTLGSAGLTNSLIRVLNNHDQNDNNLLVKSLNDRLDKLWNDFHKKYPFEYDSFGIPLGAKNISDNYWTSSEYNDNQAIRMNLGSVEWSNREKTYYSTIKAKPEDKTSSNFAFGGNDYPAKVRPFLAF